MQQNEDDAVPFRTILQAELGHIEDARGKRGTKARVPHSLDPRDSARKADLIGLAFSGGGIRSATFNLGVLQGLAEYNLLQEVDYLSTVSGGGYIGAWYISMLRENGTYDQVAEVQQTLKQPNAHHPERQDQDPIHVLRQFSNYLTPRFSLTSADVWTMVACWTRNTLLNLLQLVFTIAAVLLAVRLIGFVAFNDVHYPAVDLPGIVGCALFIAIATLFICLNLLARPDRTTPEWIKNWFAHENLGLRVAMVFTAVSAVLTFTHWLWNTPENLGKVLLYVGGFFVFLFLYVAPAQRGNDSSDWVKKWFAWENFGVQLGIVFPLVSAGLFLAHWLRNSPQNLTDGFFFIGGVFVFLFVCFMLVCISGGLLSCFCEDHPYARFRKLRGWGLALLASSIPAFVTTLLLCSVARVVFTSERETPWFLLAMGPPLMLAGLSVGEILQLGLIGRDFNESAREWFGRVRAWTLIYTICWAMVCSASVYGPLWLTQLWSAHFWTAFGITGTWVATTIGGLLSAKSKGASGEGESKGNPNVALELLARVAPFVFMVGFVLAISFGLHLVLTWDLDPWKPSQTDSTAQSGKLQVDRTPEKLNVKVEVPSSERKTPLLQHRIEQYFQNLSYPSEFYCLQCSSHFLSAPWNLFAILTLAGIVLALRLDINVFSLHEFYKNRLVRCYLGASRWRKRTADKFTGFDEKDDTHLKRFHSRERDGRYYGPYPIINTTMNVSAGENLAWQQRKSVPFIFSPLYSGYNVEGGNEAMRLDETPGERARYAYRPTGAYCYPKGVHLGTAVAVSGAATSPNQGYHTSTAVAFLMTVFDVRLGWWVGNPRERVRAHWFPRKYRISRTYRRATPRFNLSSMLSELFGSTNAESGYVNLSDGGHFDNMGLYELIRRRCRFIIVADAEQDPDLTFESMNSAIRNCRMDFGVEIKIQMNQICKDDKGFSHAHCVVGRIEYPEDKDEKDAKGRPREDGYLLYLKSSLTGDEPADVTGYHAKHFEFPHQTTANQWFTEDQFESYRRLGYHVLESAVSQVHQDLSNREKYFHSLASIWHPPSSRGERFTDEHARRFAELMASIGDEDHMAFLDSQLFKGWRDQELNQWRRKAQYQIGALIDFMSTVQRQLNLGIKIEKEHPHNQGWLNIFRYWVRQPDFQKTWERAQYMYEPRFREFYDDLCKSSDANGPRED